MQVIFLAYNLQLASAVHPPMTAFLAFQRGKRVKVWRGSQRLAWEGGKGELEIPYRRLQHKSTLHCSINMIILILFPFHQMEDESESTQGHSTTHEPSASDSTHEDQLDTGLE